MSLYLQQQRSASDDPLVRGIAGFEWELPHEGVAALPRPVDRTGVRVAYVHFIREHGLETNDRHGGVEVLGVGVHDAAGGEVPAATLRIEKPIVWLN